MAQVKVPKLLIIGASGATWDVLTPLVQKGRAPNIARLLASGTGAPLASVKAEGDKHYRPQTAWPSLATGRHPSRHGVTQFYHEADELQEPTLWDIYSKSGLSSGIYGWPGTWPPPQVDGFVVPSHLARDASTWPRQLRDIKLLDREQQSIDREGNLTARIRGALSAAMVVARYNPRLRTLYEVVVTAPAALLGDFEQRRLFLRRLKLLIGSDIFISLMRSYKPDLAAFVTFYVDIVSHRYWVYNQPGSHQRFQTAVEDSYETFDKVVGDLVAAQGEGGYIAVVSEHGMSAEPVSSEVGDFYYHIKAKALWDALGLKSDIEIRHIARWISFCPALPQDIPLIAKNIREIVVVETGLPLFQVYEHNNEIVVKFDIERGVPLYASGNLAALTVRIGASTVPFTHFARQSGPPRSAMHERDGIFVLAGPRVRKGHWLAQASILDVAPTLLKAVGLEWGLGFDGKALDVFSP